MPEHATIEHKYFGGMETVSFADFAGSIIQDDDEAARIARWLADHDGDTYPWNDHGEPEFYAEFSCLDAAELRRQIDAA